MTDVIDVLYRLRNLAGSQADELRAQIIQAQTLLDKLDAFSRDAEDTAQLAAASAIFPAHQALPPTRAGLTYDQGPKR